MNARVLILVLMLLQPLARLHAQLYPPNEAGISMAYWRTIVRDINETRNFWISLGGTPLKVDGTDVIKFPGVLVFLIPGTPSAGSEGSIVDHVGLGVLSVEDSFAKWKAASLKKMSELHRSRLNNEPLGAVYTPDGLMVEITQEAGVAPYPRLPSGINAESNHIEFHLPEASRKQLQEWYVNVLGAKPEEQSNGVLGADIPGVRFLRWVKSDVPPSPTKGRALDAIGFEVTGLEQYCEKLKQRGIHLDGPYSKSRHTSFASAELTDPLGTSIELTEGLRRF